MLVWWPSHSYICSCYPLYLQFVKKSFVCDTFTFLVNFGENIKSFSETRTVMSGVWAWWTFINWLNTLIDIRNETIGGIVIKM